MTVIKTQWIDKDRKPRDAKPTAIELPVIGRAGTRERVRAADACFGGEETR